MAKRSGVSVPILGVAQAAYLVFTIVHVWRHGFPIFGEGSTNPYLAYLALNTLSLPLATLPLPLLFTVVASRQQHITARAGRMLREVWLNSLLLVPGAALLFKGVVEGRIGHVIQRLDQPLWFLLLEGLVFLVLADLWFYVSHRALHSRLLYRFHKAHHAHRTPTEAAAFLALSPVEAYVSGLGTIAFPLFLVPVHAPVVIGCAVIILLCGFYIHEGALLRTPGLPLINGPAQHQLHHGRGRVNANYALLFTILDRMFGTYAAPSRLSPEVPAVE